MILPKVSIIIPVYNVEAYLNRCLDSVISQTFHHIEIIIVNDGSTDGSYDILLDYQKKDVRICLINQNNQGLSGARNSGINAANGEYLLFVDSDDFIDPTLVEECLQRIEKDKSDILVYGYKKIHEDLSLIAQPYLENKVMQKNQALQKLLSLDISPMACNKLIKTSLLKENHIYFPLAKLHEDVGTMYKIFWHAKQVSTTSKSYYYWITRESSITGKITFRHINHVTELLIEKKAFLEKHHVLDIYLVSYHIGALKLIVLLIERSLNTSKTLVEYILFIIDQQTLISEIEIENLEKSAPDIWAKYHKLRKEAQNFLNTGDIDHQTFYALQKENRTLKNELDRIHATIFYTGFKYYITLRDHLFPKGSKRREVLKKFKGRS